MNQYFSASKPSAIISNDSFYFFSDTELKQLLLNLNGLLADEGVLIINYPVLEAFRGVHDLSVGIKRRKNKKELERLLVDGGFQIASAEFWPFLLSPLLFLVRACQRVKLKIRKNVEITSDVSMPTSLLNKVFYCLTKAEEAIPNKPWGSSLFIVAKKR